MISAQRPRREEPANAPAAAVIIGGHDQELLLHLLKLPRLSALVEGDDFVSAGARAVWTALRSLEPWGSDWSVRLVEKLSPAEKTAAQRLLVQVDNLGKDDAEARVNAILTRRRNQRRLAELETLLRDGGLQEKALRDEFNRLLVQLKGSPAKA